MKKKRQSVLDPYRDQLISMDRTNTLAQLKGWLLKQGVSISITTLCQYMTRERTLEFHEKITREIMTGKNVGVELEQNIEQNPPPTMESIQTWIRVLIASLSANGTTDKKSLQLCNQLLKTSHDYIANRNREAHAERVLLLNEQRALDVKKDEQQKALEYCLAESKNWPEVENLFKTAFAALKDRLKPLRIVVADQSSQPFSVKIETA